MAFVEAANASGGSGSGLTTVMLTCGGSNGGQYTRIDPDGTVTSTKLPYNQSNTPVNDDYCTITGTKTSDTLTVKKACKMYYATGGAGATMAFFPVEYSADWAANYVRTNVYNSCNFMILVFE